MAAKNRGFTVHATTQNNSAAVGGNAPWCTTSVQLLDMAKDPLICKWCHKFRIISDCCIWEPCWNTTINSFCDCVWIMTSFGLLSMFKSRSMHRQTVLHASWCKWCYWCGITDATEALSAECDMVPILHSVATNQMNNNKFTLKKYLWDLKNSKTVFLFKFFIPTKIRPNIKEMSTNIIFL
jgi:hypothetical protein